jgi:hypothetical protein
MKQQCTRIRLSSVCGCLIIASLALSADATQPGGIDWIQQFNSIGPAPTMGNAVAVDGEGNVYTAGLVAGALTGEDDPVFTHAFVRKYSSSGTELWTRQFGTGGGLTGTDQALSITVDGSGVYLAGSVGGTLPGQTTAGNADAFVRKYSLDGDEIWTRQFGTTGADQANGIFADADSIYVVGTVAAALPGQVATGGTDAFVRRYDITGHEVWTRQFGTTLADRGLGIVVDASGVYAVGVVTVTGNASADAFVRRFDHDGTLVWTRQFGGESAPGQPFGSDAALAVALDASGVYVAGSVGFRLPGQPTGDASNAFVRKYDGAGTELWTRQFSTVGTDSALALSVDASGVYVAGVVATTLPGQASAGQSDAFVRRYDFDGLELWTRQFGTAGADTAAGVVAAPGAIFVAGSVGGPLPDQAATGLPDAFVRAYDILGAVIWTRQFGTTQRQDDTVRGVAIRDGHVYAAGNSGVILPSIQTVGGGFLHAYAPDGTVQWTRRISTDLPMPAGTQGVAAVAADDSGVYVVGDVVGAFTGQTYLGSVDVFVRKYDQVGEELWTRELGTTFLDSARGVAVDETGVYVVGSVSAFALPGQVNIGLTDAFIRKYSLDGVELWTRQFGTTQNDQGLAVAVGAGNVFVVGAVAGAFPGYVNAGNSDAFVRAYDRNGTPLWTAQFGNSGVDQAVGVSADITGVYVSGIISRSVPPGTIAGRDAFVRKFSPAGLELWVDQFGSGNPIESAIAESVVAGPRGVYATALVGTTGMVLKFSTDGGEVWSHDLNTTDSALVPWGIAADASGPYVGGAAASVTGGFRGAFLAAIADFTPIGIDIKPGDTENTVNLGSNGNVPVAILSSATFDAATIDPVSITLENAAVRLRGNGTAMATLQDVNGDGRSDLVVHVLTQALTLSDGDTQATLRARTFSGEAVRGTDTVRIVR